MRGGGNVRQNMGWGVLDSDKGVEPCAFGSDAAFLHATPSGPSFTDSRSF